MNTAWRLPAAMRSSAEMVLNGSESNAEWVRQELRKWLTTAEPTLAEYRQKIPTASYLIEPLADDVRFARSVVGFHAL